MYPVSAVFTAVSTSPSRPPIAWKKNSVGLNPLRSTALYVALGWVATAAAWPVLALLSPQQLLLIAAGGAAYMVGAVFFLIDHRLRYSHFIWHLFVLAGTTCHFFAVLWYSAPGR